jgi:hypothetical protein
MFAVAQIFNDSKGSADKPSGSFSLFPLNTAVGNTHLDINVNVNVNYKKMVGSPLWPVK